MTSRTASRSSSLSNIGRPGKADPASVSRCAGWSSSMSKKKRDVLATFGRDAVVADVARALAAAENPQADLILREIERLLDAPESQALPPLLHAVPPALRVAFPDRHAKLWTSLRIAMTRCDRVEWYV